MFHISGLVFSRCFASGTRSIYTNIIGNHTTTLCTTPTKCTSQLLESQDFRCVLLLFWQHTTEQKNHQNQKFKDTQRLIRLHAQRLLISHLWVNTTSDSIAYYFVVFLAFYHFVLIAFIRFPFSLMVIVCFPKCSRTGDTHTHTHTWMPSSMFERVKNRDDESATCLFNYLHRPDLLKHRIAKRRIFFTQMELKNRTEQAIVFHLLYSLNTICVLCLIRGWFFGSSTHTPQCSTKTRHDFFPVYCLRIYIKTLSSYLDEYMTMWLLNERLRAHKCCWSWMTEKTQCSKQLSKIKQNI